MAKNNENKPAKKSSLGMALRNYMCEKQNTYNYEFDKMNMEFGKIRTSIHSNGFRKWDSCGLGKLPINYVDL